MEKVDQFMVISSTEVDTRSHVIALLQRVSHAEVTVEGKSVGAIGRGLLVLVGVRPTDDEVSAKRLLARLLRYRIFPDGAGKDELGLTQVAGPIAPRAAIHPGGGYGQGLKTRFFDRRAPGTGPQIVRVLVQAARAELGTVSKAVLFGAHMQVSLTNDGPVTIWLES